MNDVNVGPFPNGNICKSEGNNLGTRLPPHPFFGLKPGLLTPGQPNMLPPSLLQPWKTQQRDLHFDVDLS